MTDGERELLKEIGYSIMTILHIGLDLNDKARKLDDAHRKPDKIPADLRAFMDRFATAGNLRLAKLREATDKIRTEEAAGKGVWQEPDHGL